MIEERVRAERAAKRAAKRAAEGPPRGPGVTDARLGRRLRAPVPCSHARRSPQAEEAALRPDPPDPRGVRRHEAQRPEDRLDPPGDHGRRLRRDAGAGVPDRPAALARPAGLLARAAGHHDRLRPPGRGGRDPLHRGPAGRRRGRAQQPAQGLHRDPRRRGHPQPGHRAPRHQPGRGRAHRRGRAGPGRQPDGQRAAQDPARHRRRPAPRAHRGLRHLARCRCASSPRP